MISRKLKVSRQDAERLRARGLISRFQLAVPGSEIDLGLTTLALATRILKNASKVGLLVNGEWVYVTVGNIDSLGKYFGDTAPVVEKVEEVAVEPVVEVTEADEEPVTVSEADDEPAVVEAPKTFEEDAEVKSNCEVEDGALVVDPATNLVQVEEVAAEPVAEVTATEGEAVVEAPAEEPAKKISVSKKNKKKK